MIRMIQSTSSASAKSYFNDALIKSDYYIDDQEMKGIFGGKLSARLGLSHDVTKEQFFLLCDNVHPTTGKPLTPMTIDNRTVGYDISFHVPKSVSIVHALSNDDHIIKAFQNAVRSTMNDIEADSMTRVRKQGVYEDRETGELAYAEFIHQTSRPVEGYICDPHLHAHIYTFNATHDPIEGQIKAGQFRYTKRDMPYYEGRFQKRLADELMAIGYGIRKTNKSFEIANVPKEAIDLFSKRTNAIGQYAREHGIHDPAKLAELGARTRSKKQKSLTMGELRESWRSQIKELNLPHTDKSIRFGQQLEPHMYATKDCLEFAKKHSFERASVVRDRRLLESAYRNSIGRSEICLSDIDAEFVKDTDLIKVEGYKGQNCTQQSVLKEEQEMVKLARDGQGKFVPMYRDAPFVQLEGQQKAAIEHILTTSHQTSIIRGAAGTGKTTLMTEAVKHIEDKGLRVQVIAPTSEAAKGVLVNEGFKNAETLAKLLTDKKLQNNLNGQVIWCDEAGLIGTQDMKSLLEIAHHQKARLILSGDTKQHSSVTRGDALRILNVIGKIKTAEVTKIYRQKDERYKEAISDLSKGDIKGGFEKLDKIESIITVPSLDTNKILIEEYLGAIKKDKSVLIVSPTHQQGKSVTQDLRIALKKEGVIQKKDHQALKLTSLNLTEAQKSDWRSFQTGQVLQFTKNSKNLPIGSKWEVAEILDQDIIISNAKHGKEKVPLSNPGIYEVYNEEGILFSKGDKVRITKNALDLNKGRLNNGHHLEVLSISTNGEINLINPVNKATFRIEKNFGHIDHGYCSTSHSSQGKTVDIVLISQPSATFSATDAKQFYVSASRGREAAKIFTDDKEALLEYASQLNDRQSASELIEGYNSQNNLVLHIEREMDTNSKPDILLQNTFKPVKNRDYEPEI